MSIRSTRGSSTPSTAATTTCAPAGSLHAGPVAALSPGEEAGLGEAFEEVDRLLRGAAGRERLAVLGAALG